MREFNHTRAIGSNVVASDRLTEFAENVSSTVVSIAASWVSPA